ncbi:CLUMA_CG010939, isoform A [Clunio marinus]|uniref:CLUMA_CG010939, isoform A n=1 Tax=Clunio marinus TaxID=568069 RepID=A0A1J1IGH4_9DIPT|nr:CLUMA_CG010939, isoform A [Clunio marinus]
MLICNRCLSEKRIRLMVINRWKPQSAIQLIGIRLLIPYSRRCEAISLILIDVVVPVNLLTLSEENTPAIWQKMKSTVKIVINHLSSELSLCKIERSKTCSNASGFDFGIETIFAGVNKRSLILNKKISGAFLLPHKHRIYIMS